MKFLNIKLQGIDQNGFKKEYTLSDFNGKNVLLYFYPKDDTPGCTKEAKHFKDNLDKIKPYVQIIGVSKDNLDSHIDFQDKYGLDFILLSDPTNELAKAFEVIDDKAILGVERTTFFIDDSGKIQKEWHNVNPDKHIDDVLEYLKSEKLLLDEEASEDF